MASVPARDLQVGDQVFNGLGPRKVIERIEPGSEPDYIVTHFEKGKGMFWFGVYELDELVEVVQ